MASSSLGSTAVCSRRQRSRNNTKRRPGHVGVIANSNSRDNEAFNLNTQRNINLQSFAFYILTCAKLKRKWKERTGGREPYLLEPGIGAVWRTSFSAKWRQFLAPISAKNWRQLALKSVKTWGFLALEYSGAKACQLAPIGAKKSPFSEPVPCQHDVLEKSFCGALLFCLLAVD